MKILVTGGTGMVGNAFTRLETSHEIISVGTKDYDLRDVSQARAMITDIAPDAVIHLAARVGGVKGNTDFIADFFHDNILINTNVLEACRISGIPKVVSLLSTCVYPDSAALPLSPEKMHYGEPHESNFGYAYAKRMLDVHSRAIRQQYGFKYVTVIPNNLYGRNDNFHLDESHVIPAMMRKIWEAKQNNSKVTLWGDGSPLREFTFSDDVAKILVEILESPYDFKVPVNIGCTGEISVKQVAEKICDILGYKFRNIEWDITKPVGQYRKPSCNREFLQYFPKFEYTDLDTGLADMASWFMEAYPNVRGV